MILNQIIWESEKLNCTELCRDKITPGGYNIWYAHSQTCLSYVYLLFWSFPSLEKYIIFRIVRSNSSFFRFGWNKSHRAPNACHLYGFLLLPVWNALHFKDFFCYLYLQALEIYKTQSTSSSYVWSRVVIISNTKLQAKKKWNIQIRTISSITFL